MVAASDTATAITTECSEADKCDGCLAGIGEVYAQYYTYLESALDSYQSKLDKILETRLTSI